MPSTRSNSSSLPSSSYTAWLLVISVFLGVLVRLGHSFAANNPVKVVVTGAGSSVGYHVFKKLLQRKNFYPIALVRTKKAYKSLLEIGAQPEQVKIGDIRKKETLKGAFDGATRCVLCTSARPRRKLGFKIRNFFGGITGKEKKPDPADLYYPADESPYHVDYLGQKHVIDEMMRVGAEHIVMLGNMGGYRGSKLNDIGRNPDETDPKVGNLLKWKRAAERYLMKRCFFTIVHSASLTDEKGGQREIIWDVDDALLRTPFRKIPREDVAEVLVQALIHKEAIGRSIDVSSLQENNENNDKAPIAMKDWLRFWSIPGNCCYPADFDNIDV
jgi:hypothetical protein